MPPDIAIGLAHPGTRSVAHAWRQALLVLGLAWALLVGLFAGEWLEMARLWWDASTYNHILLIPFILAWLVHLRWPLLRELMPHAWWPGLVLVAGAAAGWTVARATDLDLISQAAAVVMVIASVPTLLGPRVTAGLLFPLGYMLFLVPFGDELVPWLQSITAQLAIWLTHLSGVPARIEGVFIDTPAGLFEVAEACSGVKFLVGMVALGTLVAHLCFASVRRRAVFIAVAIVLPVLANGVRAWGTIFIAQSQGIEFAAGFDHIVYGWVFFALVMAAVLGIGSRFFDREPDAPPIDMAAVHSSPWLARWSRHRAEARVVLLGIVIVAAGALAAKPLLAALLARP